MKKIIIAVLIILIIICVILLVSRSSKKNPTGIVPVPTLTIAASPTPIALLSPIPKITVDSAKKIRIGEVQMVDFYQAPEEITADGNVLIQKTDVYTIEYYPSNSLFHVSVTGSPFEIIRQQAEQSFLSVLGITKLSACKLNVEIATPFWANKDESGTIYPLSFCSR